MQKLIATFWPPFPPTDCVVQSSFEITLFLLKHILPHYSLARLSHWRKDCLAHDQSQNFLGHQSLPLLCSPNILYHMYCLADGCKMQSHVTKWLSLGYSWPSVSTGGSRLVVFKLQKYFDTHWPHWPGEDDYRPASFFPNSWLNQKSWYLKNVQKDVECRRDAKGWLSG